MGVMESDMRMRPARAAHASPTNWRTIQSHHGGLSAKMRKAVGMSGAILYARTVRCTAKSDL
jgi:hypothetical protein